MIYNKLQADFATLAAIEQAASSLEMNDLTINVGQTRITVGIDDPNRNGLDKAVREFCYHAKTAAQERIDVSLMEYKAEPYDPETPEFKAGEEAA